MEAMIDLALERNLERFFIHPLANEKQDTVLEMMRHPRAVVTFSDAGATSRRSSTARARRTS